MPLLFYRIIEIFTCLKFNKEQKAKKRQVQDVVQDAYTNLINKTYF